MGYTAIGIALILIVGIVFSTQITSWWNDFNANNQASAQAKALAPQITKGITVCNLKVTIISQLTSNLFSPAPDNMKIVTTHYNWLNCRTATSTLSLIQLPVFYPEQLTNGYGGNLPLYDFALVSNTNIPVSLVLSNAQGQQYDSNLLPALTQYIHVPAGFVKEPYGSTLTYLITNIPRGDYKASASSTSVTMAFGSLQVPAGSSVSWQVFGNQNSQ